MIELVDTHCHVHFPDYELDADETVQAAIADGVTRLVAVGCTLPDSQLAVEFAKRHANVWASIGLHPHEGAVYVEDERALQQFRGLAARSKVVAIGETGLDYYYNHSPKEDQKQLLKFQLDLASEHNLPLIFHIRDAFDEFWPIFDEHKGLKGVVHSFTADSQVLEEVLSRGLFVGINGIMTFTKDAKQLDMAKKVPLNRLLLETDAPFLTPVPFRGKICQPKHTRVTAEFLSQLRGESLQTLAEQTTKNARSLFNLT
jgi:TatD DNase family protein